MPDCPVCAYDNAADAPRCTNCGADLRPAARTEPLVPYAPVTGPARFAAAGADRSGGSAPAASGTPAWGGGAVPPPREERRPEPARKRTGADLVLEPDELEIEPGSTMATTVTVHNLGDEVERFTLEVNGPAGAFATAEPADLRMLPDKKQSAVIRFAPARSPEQPAGPQAFQVVARSTVNPDVMPRASGRVVVGSYTEVGADLEPEATRGRRPGTHRIEAVNKGNGPATVVVELHDKDRELTFVPDRLEGRLGPGGRLEHDVTVVGPIPWFGRTQTFPFTADVTVAGLPQPIQLQGTRRQVPRFPWWVPTAALAVVAMIVAALALWPKPAPDTIPNVALQTQADAEARLIEAGYTPVPIAQVSTEVEAGQAIGTEPAAGAQFAEGDSVSLFVSQGPCPQGGCPVPVPSVSGLPVDRAEEHITAAGFAPERRPEPSELPADQVTRSEPPAATPLTPGTTVALFVSQGPATASPAASPSASETSAPATSAPASSEPAGGSGAGGTVVMPALAGLSGAAALALLEKLPFGVEVTEETRTTNEHPAGTVLSTEPAAQAPLRANQPVTIVRSAPTLVAPDPAAAAWTAGTQPLSFPTPPGGAAPVARTERATPGNEESPLLLLTAPAAEGFVRGLFRLEAPLIVGDHLRADVLVGEGVTIAVRAGGEVLKGAPAASPGSDGYRTFDVDLTSQAGVREIEITVTSSGVAGTPRVTWRDLRIEGQTE